MEKNRRSRGSQRLRAIASMATDPARKRLPGKRSGRQLPVQRQGLPFGDRGPDANFPSKSRLGELRCLGMLPNFPLEKSSILGVGSTLGLAFRKDRRQCKRITWVDGF